MDNRHQTEIVEIENKAKADPKRRPVFSKGQEVQFRGRKSVITGIEKRRYFAPIESTPQGNVHGGDPVMYRVDTDPDRTRSPSGVSELVPAESLVAMA